MSLSACLLQGMQKRPLPLVLCLKVQYYLENGRLIWYVLHLSTILDNPASILVLLSGIFLCAPLSLFSFFSVSGVVPVNERHGTSTILM